MFYNVMSPISAILVLLTVTMKETEQKKQQQHKK